jgi:hypothetical protein
MFAFLSTPLSISVLGKPKSEQEGVFQFYVFSVMCWRRLESSSWIDLVKNGKALYRVKKERNILHAINETKER